MVGEKSRIEDRVFAEGFGGGSGTILGAAISHYHQ